MSGREFAPASSAPGVEDILGMFYTDGQTFKKGALVLVQTTGLISECSADPTSITGVALQGAATGLGYDAANSPTVITGRNQEVSVAVANRNTVFSGRGITTLVDPVIPLQTHIGEQYGTAKDSDGIWVIDFDEVTTKTIQIVDIDLINNTKVFFFKFLEAALQTP